ncbi:MAG: hypothetical protein A2017_08405 [Lentisphaerae bacterium GWF2_44_16]|nr:MAG: hypothetical protein A2017_08405 [Lentisphaerae bacterium GWF2_44_16]
MKASPVFSFAQKLYEKEIEADIRNDASDWYEFSVAPDGKLDVKAGTERAVLYAVYDALDGKKSGNEKPEFSIRGLNPCESLKRHTKEQIIKLIDRMGRWRMNTIIIHSNYGFVNHKNTIVEECAKRGIEMTHYTYSNLSFMRGIENTHFAKDENGKPLYDNLECETRLCVNDKDALNKYAEGVKKYLGEHSDYERMLFATADGRSLCLCPACRNKNAIEQWQPVFDVFFDTAYGKRKLEMISYVQRFSVPADTSRISKLDSVMFDTHIRYPRTPLGVFHEFMKEGYDVEVKMDSRAARPVNLYLLDRIKDWRKSFSGKLYIFENLMIQGILGCPRPNTSVYLEDLKTFRKAGVDGVVYECFEPGIKPFLKCFDKIAAAMWNVNAVYEKDNFEKAYLEDGASDTDPWAVWPGCEKWDGVRSDYPMSELSVLYYKVIRSPDKDNIFNMMDYVMEHENREDFDWLYILFTGMKKAFNMGFISPESEKEKQFLCMRKLWDFQELRQNPRQETINIIKSLMEKERSS